MRATPAKSFSASYGSFERTAGLIVKLFAMISSVWPSAGERAATSVPTTVPAPGRFSTTMFWPSVFESGPASMRARVSVPAPGGNGAMMRMGFEGNVCA